MLIMLTERQHVTTIDYSREFLDDERQGGFSFPCDKDGNVLPTIPDCAKSNFQECIDGKHPDLTDMGVCECKRSYVEPATGKCPHCGKVVECIDEYQGAFQCECGQWYNMFGQELIPPEQWEDD